MNDNKDYDSLIRNVCRIDDNVAYWIECALKDGRIDDADNAIEQMLRPKFRSVEDCLEKYNEAMGLVM